MLYTWFANCKTWTSNVWSLHEQLGGGGFHVFNSDQSLFEMILGGSLFIFGGGFCITCLHRLKRKQQATQPEMTFENANPDRTEPEYTKQSDD